MTEDEKRRIYFEERARMEEEKVRLQARWGFTPWWALSRRRKRFNLVLIGIILFIVLQFIYFAATHPR